MSAKFPTAKLTDIAELNPTLGKKLPAEELVSFVPMASLSAESASVETTQDRPYAEVAKGFTPFLDGDVLVAKITPCFENGKIAQARLPRSHGFGSTEFHVVRARSGVTESRYLHHYLRLEEVRTNGQRRMTGSGGQRRVPSNFLADLAIPLPPLEEQRRIAAILDQAETLRTQRRTALALLDNLTQSLFLDMFGDPVANPKGWPIKHFGDVGTNEDYKRIPVKSSDRDSRKGQYAYYGASGIIDWVDEFLFDGTRLLVGEDGANLAVRATPVAYMAYGKYWVNNHAHVIAENSQANLRYLEYFIEQIDLKPYLSGSAQPKLNRANLDRIPVALPPIALQQTFATRIAAIEALKATHRQALATLDALFASLQQRAFAGAL